MQFLQKLQNHQIILASQSPRRRELLRAAGIPVQIEVREITEDYPSHLSPVEVALFLSKKKTQAFADKLYREKVMVIAADTIVAIEGEILHKPVSYQVATQMLQKLSGRCHTVITGVCIAHRRGIHAFSETTLVWFRKLHPDEIDYYISNFKPFDKAGAYGIQEWIGHTAVRRIEGSYSNVVGLPVERVYTELKTILEILD